MAAARTAAAGSMNRLEKSSIDRVRSCDVKLRPTCFWVVTDRVVDVSAVSCASSCEPVVTV